MVNQLLKTQTSEILMKTTKIILSLLVGTLFAGASASHAVLVVDFNSDGYVTGNVQMRDTNGTTALPSSFTGRAFNTTGSLISNSVSGYSGPTLYGGMSNSLGENFTLARVTDNGTNPFSGISNDYLTVRVNHTTASTAGSLQFLIGGVTSGVSFDNTSSIQFDAVRGSGTGHGGFARAVIQINSDYYISRNTSLALSATYGPGTFGDLTTLTWTSYNPTTSLVYVDNGLASISLTDINYAGVLFNMDYGTTAGTGNKDIGVGRLAVDAIPEPSAALMLLGGLAGIFLRRRRR